MSATPHDFAPPPLLGPQVEDVVQVRAAMDPCLQVLKVALQARLVVLPCHTVHPGRGTALGREERIPQQVDGDVMRQRGELLLLPLPCCVPYAIQPR